MSFAAKVKKEIYLSRPVRSPFYKAFCYGLLLFGKSFDETGVFTGTEHITVSKLYGHAIRDSIGQKADFTEQKVFRGAPLYTVELSGEENISRLLSFFEVGEEIQENPLTKGEAFPMFFCGAFMSCGTISEPAKGYHLELLPPSEQLADFLFERLFEAGYPAKSTQRRSQTVLYFKESGQIEDLLTMMGATRSSLELMETKIYKDLRNRANRAANCDAANAGKALRAASQQLSDIALLRKSGLLETLSAAAIQVAELREQNPDASLSELAEASGLSRSAVNHRFAQIAAKAAQKRGDGGE